MTSHASKKNSPVEKFQTRVKNQNTRLGNLGRARLHQKEPFWKLCKATSSSKANVEKSIMS